jgi:3-methyladenine DNA glycosylase/8-oxoguanine DNA glycosylase
MVEAALKDPPFPLREAERHLRAASPSMARLIDRTGPCTLRIHELEPFDALLRSIVYQQLAGSAAAAILGRVRALFPRTRPTPAAVLAMAADRLRSAGLSRAKEAAIRDLARHAAAGVLPSRRRAASMSEVELVETFTRIRGIGPWTVQMFLIFGLGKPDVWPALDFGVRKGLGVVHRRPGLPSVKDAIRFGERYAPYRSVAAWYFWRAAETAPRPRRTAAPVAARAQRRSEKKVRTTRTR